MIDQSLDALPIHPSIYLCIYLSTGGSGYGGGCVKVASKDESDACTRVCLWRDMQGDSGGPYACKDQQDGWTLIGVNSYVFLRCEQTFVARVTSYVDWIRQTMASYP